MSPLRLNGSTSGYSQLDAPAIAGDQTFTLPGTGGTLVTTASAGKILQVVYGTTSTFKSTGGNTFIDTDLTATITPSSASSKILILLNQCGIGKATGDTALSLQLLRDSTVILSPAKGAGYTGSTAFNYLTSVSASCLDSPATTSSVTYKTQFRSNSNINVVYVQTSSEESTIALLEVAA